jgi:hypothetical protein
MKAWTSLLAIGFAAGCGGGGSALEGIYSLDTWNENTTSCADPGSSVLSLHSQTVFYLKKESLLGHSFLNMVGCGTAEECHTKANDDTIDLDLEFPFYEQGNDDDGYTEHDSFGFEDFNDATMCQGTITDATLTADATGVAVRIETVHVPLYPKPGSGECDDGVEAAGAGLPCDQLETVHGTFMEDL